MIRNYNRENDGITPAYAGKSGSACLRCSDAEDHPRLCGEKPLQVMTELVSMGSPPPMRGKEKSFGFCDLEPGITPAYAGKRNPPQKIIA